VWLNLATMTGGFQIVMAQPEDAGSMLQIQSRAVWVLRPEKNVKALKSTMWANQRLEKASAHGNLLLERSQ
jgi:hypothetical protein